MVVVGSQRLLRVMLDLSCSVLLQFAGQDTDLGAIWGHLWASQDGEDGDLSVERGYYQVGSCDSCLSWYW